MKIERIGRCILVSSMLAGAFQTHPARAQSGTWANPAGGSWAVTTNWAAGIIASGSGNTADFSALKLTASPTVTLDANWTIGNLIFGDTGNTYGWTLNTGSAGTLTLAGSPLITVDGQTSTIGAVLSGSGFTKTGSGTLTLTGAETYTGSTTISAGTLDLAGTSSGGSTTSSLYVGGATGNGVLNFSTSGSWSWSVSGGALWVGGGGGTADTGAGALNQSAGTINFGSGYVTMGAVGANSYGSYLLSGGTLFVTNNEGVRTGYGGMGSWVQTGGTLVCPRYFSIGGAAPTGNGVATFLGGTANVGTGGYRFLVPDTSGATAVLNVGTEAGGSAFIFHPYGNGLYMENNPNGVGTLNLDSGTLQLGGPIFRVNSSGGSATVNLDGATVQAGGEGVTLINSTLSSVNMYNGGIVFDSTTNAYDADVSATLLAASGSGIYPTNGILTVTNGGSGYIGAPLVTINGGSGFGAMAIGNVSNGVVTGVTLTCPGQNYQAGDTLSIVFAGGGPVTPANTNNYILKAADVAVNTAGGVKIIGGGSVTLSSPSTYLGNTIVGGGTLDVTEDGGLGYGSVIVSNGASLNLSGGNTNGYISSVGSLILGTNATATLNYSGTDPIVGLSTNGGKNYVAPGLWGAVGSGATYTSSLLSGSGFLQVTAPSNGTPVEVSSYTAAQNVYAGHSAVFSVKLGLGTAPTYQWEYSDGATVTNDVKNGATGTGSFIYGATTATLTISNVSPADASYYYTCLVTNGLPSAAATPLAPLTLLVSTNGPVTRPGDPIADFYNAIGTADPYPSGTPTADINDGTLAPYINYGEYGTGNSFAGPVGFVVTPSIGSSLVTGARIYTSANAQADDPADFTLYGSDDGTNWSLIDYTLLALPLARNASGGTINSNNEVLQEIDFPNTTGYYLYAVFFTNTASASAVSGLDVAEVQLLGVPTNIAPGIVAEPSPSVEYRLAGGSATVSLVAHGAGTLGYQWYESGGIEPIVFPIIGATNASYTLTNLGVNLNDGDFFCVVRNAYGAITSSGVTIFVQAPTAAQQTILGFNPVAYWPLNETSGTTAFDYAGNHDGTYVGGYGLGQPGVPSTAGYGNASTSVSFDGSSAYVDIPENNLNITGPITLIQYIQSTGPGGFETTLGHGDASYRLDVDQAGDPHFADQSPDIVSTSAVTDGNWHQVVGVYDGTNGSLYVDGQLVSSGPENKPSGSSYDVWIGGAPDYSTGAGRFFAGNIAEVAIVTNALTAAQVEDLYTAQAPPGTLTIVPSGKNVVVSWTAGTLEQATSISGPWTDVSGAVSPYTVPATNTSEFYQVH